MIAKKYTSKIIAVVMAIAVCLCLCAKLLPEPLAAVMGDTGVSMEYENELFNTNQIINANILMDEEDWDEMLANATAEQYYQCDVEINGQKFYRVGIRPKGNTSLSSIANDPDSNRYSFKLEFDKFVEGQTCYGLDKLVLNNNFADATNMKEALIYDMFQYIGADASLYNYASISVNGEYWGVYLALEAVEDSFMLRNYGADSGELYKPDSMDMGDKGNLGDMGDARPRGGNKDFDDTKFDNIRPPMMSDNGEMPEDIAQSKPPEWDTSDFPKGKEGGFGMGGKGSDLGYTDDLLDSYSTIWECEVTKTSESDNRRVVNALKNISQGTEFDNYMNTDNLLKYAAVHVFSVNEDSLSGTMAHNYYLYEEDGKLNLIPWDYNLSLGGMGGMGREEAGATSVVNDAIDNAFEGTDFFDTLMADEEYHARYYAYMQQLVDEYLLAEGFQTFYTRTRSLIDELVKADPNASYTYEEYEEALDTLCEVVALRGESIKGQLNGTIPATEDEQRNSDTLIDASNLDLSVMGSMNMGMEKREFPEH